ncbi:MAG: hypothetical protein IJK89_12185 [Clostridia bacterium]|nr:hypothetical protein [Clostridia bacterium]
MFDAQQSLFSEIITASKVFFKKLPGKIGKKTKQAVSRKTPAVLPCKHQILRRRRTIRPARTAQQIFFRQIATFPVSELYIGQSGTKSGSRSSEK